MPIYEYRCRKCGHLFEQLIRSDGDRPETCPQCGAPKPEKQFSTFSAAAGTASGGGFPACPPGGCDAGECSGGACPFSGN